MRIVKLPKVPILFLVLFAALFTVCKAPPSYFAVAVANHNDYPFLSGKVLSTRSIAKEKDIKVSISNEDNTKTYTIPRSMLILFDSKKKAEVFSTTMQAYIGTSTESSTLSIIRKMPNITAPKIISVQARTSLYIVSPLLTPNDTYSENPFSTALDNAFAEDDASRGYWIRVQHNIDTKTQEYIRGWILLSEQNTIVFNGENTLNAGSLLHSIAEHNYWRTLEAIEYINKSLVVPEAHRTKLLLDEYNEEEKSPTLVLTKGAHFTNLPIAHLWPVGPYSAINPSNTIQVSWNIANKEITIAYPSGKSELYIPTVRQNKHKPTPNITKIKPYNLLIQKGVNSRTDFVTWNSDLYGSMRITAVKGSFALQIDWNIPVEISQLHYPPNTTNIKGTVTFTHSLADSVISDADVVLTLYDTISKTTRFLALQSIGSSKISLQFIPEAGVLTDTKTEFIISASPAPPNMIFDSQSIPPLE